MVGTEVHMTEHTKPSPPSPGDPRTIDRNWNELLQEIRVTETGVQILTGFLLTVPFSNRFESLDDFQRTSYLIVLCGSVLTTALVVAPAAYHRILFRHRARLWLVEAANQCARAGLVLMAVTISGVLFLAFDLVAGRTPAIVSLAAALASFATLWGLTPLVRHRRHDSGD
jgi:hypothetical protein